MHSASMTSEREFTSQVITLARLCGWRCVHFRPARTEKGWRTAGQGNIVGWPDIFAVKDGKIIVMELKIGKAKPTHEQAAWLADFAGAGVQAFVFTPADWPEIVKLLKGEDKQNSG